MKDSCINETISPAQLFLAIYRLILQSTRPHVLQRDRFVTLLLTARQLCRFSICIPTQSTLRHFLFTTKRRFFAPPRLSSSRLLTMRRKKNFVQQLPVFRPSSVRRLYVNLLARATIIIRMLDLTDFPSATRAYYVCYNSKQVIQLRNEKKDASVYLSHCKNDI